MKNSAPQDAHGGKMEDDRREGEHDDDDEIFDVLYADDEDADNNAIATLQWLDWRHRVVPREDGGGSNLVYGIPDWMMN